MKCLSAIFSNQGAKALIIALGLSVAATGCAEERPAVNPVVTMQLDSASLDKGRVVLVSVLENKGREYFTFLPWGTPFEPQVTRGFMVVKAKTKEGLVELPYQGILIKRAPAQPSDYVELGVGQTYSSKADITESYIFCRGRPYILQYQGVLSTPDFTRYSTPEVVLEFTAGDSFAVCDSKN